MSKTGYECYSAVHAICCNYHRGVEGLDFCSGFSPFTNTATDIYFLSDILNISDANRYSSQSVVGGT